MRHSSIKSTAVIALLLAVASTTRAAEPAGRFEEALTTLQPTPVPTRTIQAITTKPTTRVSLTGVQPEIPLALSVRARFQARHPLLGRISANIEGAGVSSPTIFENEPLSFTESRNRAVLRATKKAVKRFLVENLELDDLRPADSPGRAVERSGGFRFRVGVASLAPKVDLRYPVGEGTMNVTLGARGNLGVDFSPAGVHSPRVQMGYDHRTKTSGVSFRIAF